MLPGTWGMIKPFISNKTKDVRLHHLNALISVRNCRTLHKLQSLIVVSDEKLFPLPKT